MKVDDLDVVAAADLGLLEEWAVGLDALGELIGPRFFRREPRVRALAYVKALLSQVETRNGWTVAEAAGEQTPTGMQRLLNDAVWDEAGVREDLRSYVVTHLGADDGVLVFDETGDIKQGNHTVGVARQYTGVTGQVENCQVSVHAGYVSSRGQALIDAELYLPDAYAQDSEPLRRGGCAGRTGRGRDHQRGPGARSCSIGRSPPGCPSAMSPATRSTADRPTCAPRSRQPVAAATCWRWAATSGSVAVPGDKLRVDALPAEVPRWAWEHRSQGHGRERAAPPRLGLDRPGLPRLPPGWRRSLLIRRDPDDTAAAEHSSRKNSKNNKAGKNGKGGADGKGGLSRFPCKPRMTDAVTLSQGESSGEEDDQGVQGRFPALCSGSGFTSALAGDVAQPEVQ